jgi:hypothetical protein
MGFDFVHVPERSHDQQRALVSTGDALDESSRVTREIGAVPTQAKD